MPEAAYKLEAAERDFVSRFILVRELSGDQRWERVIQEFVLFLVKRQGLDMEATWRLTDRFELMVVQGGAAEKQ